MAENEPLKVWMVFNKMFTSPLSPDKFGPEANSVLNVRLFSFRRPSRFAFWGLMGGENRIKVSGT